MLSRFMFLMVFAMLIVAITTTANAQTGLVGYWPMEEGSGDTVSDKSGNGNNGKAVDTKWVDGKIGKALEFNGTNSIVDIPYFDAVTPVDGATLAAWVFPTDASRSCVVGQFESYGLALFTSLQLKSVIWGDDWVSTQTIPANEWSHLAMTWDNKNLTRSIFVNGEVVDTKDGAIPIPQVQNNLGIGLWVGWPVAWGDDFFMGIIDEVKIWNRVLNEDEVATASLPATVESQGKVASLWANIKSAF